MARETWIDNARNFRMRLKPRSDTCRAGAVLAHAHRERLDTAQREVRIERSHDTANGVLHKAQLLSKRFIADNQRAANRVAVATEILGGGANVLSQTVMAPHALPIFATAAKSTSFKVGLVGVSTQIILGLCAFTAASSLAMSVMSTNSTFKP
jgi:hypothetical protein